MNSNVKVVALGGGTGLSTMLRGLKRHTSELTAIVTMSDNGGSSGILRNELKMLPPGDVRNCILALANTEPLLEKLLNHRFKEGSLDGQNFGNMFIAAMNEIFGSFELAIEKTSEVLAVQGQVLPVTLEDIQLCATMQDGMMIEGETELVYECKEKGAKIKNVFLVPAPVKPYDKTIKAIEDADVILLGPGSLYTSIIPNLLVEGVAEAIIRSKAPKIYISNIMTQPGETDQMSLNGHLKILKQYIGDHTINGVIANNGNISEYILCKYIVEGAEPVTIDVDPDPLLIKTVSMVKIIEEEGLIRHDEDVLAKTIMEVVAALRHSS